MNRRSEDPGPLFTLSQIAERSGIHLMLLESYLHSAAWRVPTVWVAGEERYPAEALAAFQEMHAEAQRASAPAEDTRPAEGDGPAWGRRRLLSLTAQRRRPGSADDGARRSGGDAGGAAPKGPQRAPAVRSADPTPAEAAEAAIPEPEDDALPVRAAPRAGAAPRRPARRLYTLQQVHDHTGIPYPVLALYAASESSRIPAAGERHASLYPWEALAVFCRIHQERNPAWRPPALPAAPPSAEDEEQSRELAARLERLERAQTELSNQIRALLDEGERFLTATVPPPSGA